MWHHSLSLTNHYHNPTTLPTATTTWHPTPTTTHDHPTMTGQKTKMTTHKQRLPPTNKDCHPQTTMNATTWLMNDGQDPWMDMGSNLPRWASSLLPATWLINMKSRCHIADHNVATKQWMMTNVVVHHCYLFLIPQWVPPIPCSSQPTLLRHRTTTNGHRQRRAKVSQGRGANTRWGQQGHSTTTTQQRGVTMMVHGNNNMWWQCDQDMGLREPQHMMTRRWQQHMPTRQCEYSTTMDEDPAPSTATKAWHHEVTTTHLSVYPSTSPFPLSTFSLTFPLHPPYSLQHPFPSKSPFPLNLL